MKRLLLLVLFFILFNSCGFDCKSYLDRTIKPLQIDGIVLSKQKSQIGCFGIIVWKHENKIDTLKNVCYCVIQSQGLWKYVEPGDSLHKAYDSLGVKVFRDNTISEFEYPCCRQ